MGGSRGGEWEYVGCSFEVGAFCGLLGRRSGVVLDEALVVIGVDRWGAVCRFFATDCVSMLPHGLLAYDILQVFGARTACWLLSVLLAVALRVFGFVVR